MHHSKAYKGISRHIIQQTQKDKAEMSSPIESISESVSPIQGQKTFWTSQDREEWINAAIHSEYVGGECGEYKFQVMSKLGSNDVISLQDEENTRTTEALANLIYKTKDKSVYRKFSLEFYKQLVEKIRASSYIGHFYERDIIILIKGSNGHALLMPELDLSFSDLDLVIYINPRLHPSVFAYIKNTLHIILVQLLSQYKKVLDHMLFLDNPNEQIKRMWGITDEVIDQFKRDHIEAMEKVGVTSVFTDKKIRNMASRNSIVLMDSLYYDEGEQEGQDQEKKIVKIEVPHFNRCEKIPLRRTPIFCSYNETIHNKDSGREFNLYRIKFNNMKVESRKTDDNGKDDEKTPEARDDNGVFEVEGFVHEFMEELISKLSILEDKEKIKAKRCYKRVQSDFIDVIILAQDDVELTDYWGYGRHVMINEPVCNQYLQIPDLSSCLLDLWKMLNIYDCPVHKREKREKKYKLLLGKTETIQAFMGGLPV